jgi:hypothetical protein
LVAKYATAGDASVSASTNGSVGKKTAVKAAAAQAAVKGTLMLAEASPQEQAELRVFFKNLGYKVLMTENLQRALDRCSAVPRAADCLVISGTSFGETGVDAFNTMAAHPFLKDIPAVLLLDPAQHELAALAKVDDRRKTVTGPLQTAEMSDMLATLIS